MNKPNKQRGDPIMLSKKKLCPLDLIELNEEQNQITINLD